MKQEMLAALALAEIAFLLRLLNRRQKPAAPPHRCRPAPIRRNTEEEWRKTGGRLKED